MRWLRKSKNVEKSIDQNPLKRKYLLIIVFWIVLHVLIFSMILNHSNEDSQLGTLEGFVCFFNPKTNRCRKDSEWVLIRILYFFPMFYVFISSMQIHLGSKNLSSRVTSFSMLENVSHMIKKNIPVGRELSISMDYLANKSAL